jgi:hypothetical protein
MLSMKRFLKRCRWWIAAASVGFLALLSTPGRIAPKPSPLRLAYDQLREGMTIDEALAILRPKCAHVFYTTSVDSYGAFTVLDHADTEFAVISYNWYDRVTHKEFHYRSAVERVLDWFRSRL